MSAPTTYPPETIQAYVLGTLDAERAAEIARASESDSELAAEIALWQATREINGEDVANVGSNELGWARIERVIAGSEQNTAPFAANDDEPFWKRRRFAGWQVAASVAVAVLGWQALVVPAITPSSVDAPVEYTLAGDDSAVQFTLRVAIAEGVSEADMRAVLTEVDARIVDGPSAIGLYTIAFTDAEAQASGRTVLARRSDVIAEVAE